MRLHFDLTICFASENSSKAGNPCNNSSDSGGPSIQTWQNILLREGNKRPSRVNIRASCTVCHVTVRQQTFKCYCKLSIYRIYETPDGTRDTLRASTYDRSGYFNHRRCDIDCLLNIFQFLI